MSVLMGVVHWRILLSGRLVVRSVSRETRRRRDISRANNLGNYVVRLLGRAESRGLIADRYWREGSNGRAANEAYYVCCYRAERAFKFR